MIRRRRNTWSMILCCDIICLSHALWTQSRSPSQVMSPKWSQPKWSQPSDSLTTKLSQLFISVKWSQPSGLSQGVPAVWSQPSGLNQVISTKMSQPSGTHPGGVKQGIPGQWPQWNDLRKYCLGSRARVMYIYIYIYTSVNPSIYMLTVKGSRVEWCRVTLRPRRFLEEFPQMFLRCVLEEFLPMFLHFLGFPRVLSSLLEFSSAFSIFLGRSRVFLSF